MPEAQQPGAELRPEATVIAALDAVRSGEATCGARAVRELRRRRGPSTLDELATRQPAADPARGAAADPVRAAGAARHEPRGHRDGLGSSARPAAVPRLARGQPAAGHLARVGLQRRRGPRGRRRERPTRHSPARSRHRCTGSTCSSTACRTATTPSPASCSSRRPASARPTPAPTAPRSSPSRWKTIPGALLEMLTEFAVRGVNLTRLESRPTGEGLGRYCFSIDCEGHIDEERVGDVLKALHRLCADVRFLGSYPRADGTPPTVRARDRRRRLPARPTAG